MWQMTFSQNWLFDCIVCMAKLVVMRCSLPSSYCADVKNLVDLRRAFFAKTYLVPSQQHRLFVVRLTDFRLTERSSDVTADHVQLRTEYNSTNAEASGYTKALN